MGSPHFFLFFRSKRRCKSSLTPLRAGGDRMCTIVGYMCAILPSKRAAFLSIPLQTTKQFVNIFADNTKKNKQIERRHRRPRKTMKIFFFFFIFLRVDDDGRNLEMEPMQSGWVEWRNKLSSRRPGQNDGNPATWRHSLRESLFSLFLSPLSELLACDFTSSSNSCCPPLPFCFVLQISARKNRELRHTQS